MSFLSTNLQHFLTIIKIYASVYLQKTSFTLEFHLWKKYLSQYEDNGKGDRSRWQQHQYKSKGWHKQKEKNEREREDRPNNGRPKDIWEGGGKASRVTEKEKKHTYNFLVVCICGGFERAISWTTKEEGEKGWTIVD